MIRRPPRSTHCISSAASDVYKRQALLDRSTGMDWVTQKRRKTAPRDGCGQAASIGTPTTQRGRSQQTAEDSSTSAVALVALRLQPLQGLAGDSSREPCLGRSLNLKTFPRFFKSPCLAGQVPCCHPHTCLDAVDRSISGDGGQVAVRSLPAVSYTHLTLPTICSV